MNARCWKCWCEVDSKCTKLCPRCHVEEVAKIRHKENMPVGCLSSLQEDVRLGSDCGGSLSTQEKYLMQRGVARNGQVIRKGQHLS